MSGNSTVEENNDDCRSIWSRARRSHIGIAGVVALTLFTDMLVYGVVIPCLPKLVIDRLKGNSTMVGFLFGCYAFGLLVATPVFAILSDRYENRRYPMMGGMLGLSISTLAFAMADTYALLVLARVAQGVAGGASWTIGLGLLADVFPTNKLGTVMGTVLTAHTVGFALGPAIGGILYEYGGFSAPFLFCTGFAVINFLGILWLAEPTKMKQKKNIIDQGVADETTPLIAKKDCEKPLTMIDLLKNWRILSCVLCTIVSASVFSGIEPSLPIHLQMVFNASASTIGFIFVTMVVPAFLAPLIGHLSDKIGRQVISATGMIMMAISAPFIAINYSTIYWIIPSLMIFGLSSPVIMTPILPEMGETVNDMGGAAYAQVYALYNMAYSIGMFIGPVIAGFIMSAAGFKTLMFIFSLALFICSPIMVNWTAIFRKIKTTLYH
ncbi:major facilitator superfamily domain-containing protein [Cokeromyces recurvatus]|uniref:major facilitator superfamily domain-containing protein n=1 Tax=Cokeromyces recurvatus TaxID=90255 RepID=UPI00221F7DF7|nr:major facilitator superfamily domain-containing protein [Cokeromyces recurvatus]KAI7903711.1 major facilitator superfamily domain-containing protein [Cokeromyces recurvatus]